MSFNLYFKVSVNLSLLFKNSFIEQFLPSLWLWTASYLAMLEKLVLLKHWLGFLDWFCPLRLMFWWELDFFSSLTNGHSARSISLCSVGIL
jgi:hypothetical protein